MKRERIEHGNGIYVAKRAPEAEEVLGDDPCVLVKFTHDFGKAAEVAWPLWSSLWDQRRLARPYRDWWRKVPWDMCGEGWAWTWLPSKPGERGSIPVVLFEGYSESYLKASAE